MEKASGVYLRAEDIRGMTMNQRRAMTGLPPLNDQELAELNRLNQEFVDNGLIIAASIVAIVSILPHLSKNHAHLFPAKVLYHIFRVHSEFMESVNDFSPKKIDWARWLEYCDCIRKVRNHMARIEKNKISIMG